MIMVLVLKKGATKKEIERIDRKLKKSTAIDLMKFCGIIKLKEDPLIIQKRLRNEWQ